MIQLLLLSFVVGITAAEFITLPMWVAMVALLLLIVAGWLTQHRNIAFAYLAIAMTLTGYITTELRAPQPTTPLGVVAEMEIEVVSRPSPRDGYAVADGHITKWRTGEEWHRADDKVVLWLRCEGIEAGDIVTVASELHTPISRYEEYNTMMRHKGYVGGVAINESFVLDVGKHEVQTLHTRAVDKLQRYARDSSSHAIVEAMVAGERSAMPQELRSAYAATGLSHLMAVSGLHIGIAYMVIFALLIPLHIIHRGHIIISVLTVIAVWLFAIMSGLSPSTIRAAIMLSMLQLTRIVSTDYSALHSLSLALLLMLIFRPGYLYNISFQLSALAVLGILLCGIPIIYRVKVRRTIPRTIITTIIIGAVATLWTLPVVSHTFGNIPLASIALTPLVLLFAYGIIACGTITLLLPHPLSVPFAFLSEILAKCQNYIVCLAHDYGITGVEYSMTGYHIIIYYAIFVVITIIAKLISAKIKARERDIERRIPLELE